ncbi:MAG: RNA polymerase sigma factor [Myxococcota bacterium]|nr:RNA polymerase sigma factor [Myxococcota bacterium]
MISEKTDAELVHEVTQGNMVAFRSLYYRHVDNVFSLVTRILGPFRTEREDVVQEVFFQVYRSIGRFKGESSFATWVHRIAINVTYSYLRRPRLSKQALTPTALNTLSTRDMSENKIDARRAVQQMYALLEQLSVKNRVVFILYEFQGLTLDQIAQTLKIPLNTASSRLRRSRETLMQALAVNTSLNTGEV